MNIKSQKLEILRMLITTSDSALLKDVKKMLEKSKDKDSTDISTAKLASIKRGLEQIEKGQTLSHSEVRKVYEKWL